MNTIFVCAHFHMVCQQKFSKFLYFESHGSQSHYTVQFKRSGISVGNKQEIFYFPHEVDSRDVELGYTYTQEDTLTIS